MSICTTDGEIGVFERKNKTNVWKINHFRLMYHACMMRIPTCLFIFKAMFRKKKKLSFLSLSLSISLSLSTNTTGFSWYTKDPMVHV